MMKLMHYKLVRFVYIFLETKKVPVHVSNTNIEATCIKLILTEFACSAKKVLLPHTGIYDHKKALVLCEMYKPSVASSD